jgi:hypothetical protein
MAKGLKTGVKVLVRRGPFKGQIGTIQRMQGTGRARKWEVKFPSDALESFAACTLDVEGTPRAPTVTMVIAAGAEAAASSDSDSSSDGRAQSEHGSESDTSSSNADDGVERSESPLESTRFAAKSVLK